MNEYIFMTIIDCARFGRRATQIVLGFCLLTYLVLANASDSITIEVNSEQAPILITLPANPSTGYEWNIVNYDKSLLQFVRKEYLAPKARLIGAQGQMSFVFSVIRDKHVPRSTTLIFKYAQPWKPEVGTLKKVIIQFKTISSDTLVMNLTYRSLKLAKVLLLDFSH